MAAKDQNESKWKNIRNWIMGVTSVLVVLPALFNAGVDIYNIVLNIPRTDAEQHNSDLFAKHFNQEPVAVLPVPVRQGPATYEARFSIYQEGDVYVEYGEMTQWFPFPAPRVGDASPFSLIATAFADEVPTQVATSYKQTESIDGSYLIRNKVYKDGVTEKQVIDMTSGKIIETKKSKTVEPTAAAEAAPPEAAEPAAAPVRARVRAAVPPPSPAPVTTQQNLAPFAVVDLNAIQAAKGQNATAKVCTTTQGNCTLLYAVPAGSPCICQSSAGEIKGSAQ
jgi:hypothetical protein